MPLVNAHTDVFNEARGLKLVCYFIYIHTLCMRAAKALASLHICADLPESSLIDDAFSSKISCTGPLYNAPRLA